MQRKCPNCGHDVEMPPVASPTGDYCPDCGALMTTFNSKGNSGQVVLLTLLLVFVLLGCLGMGFLGACFLLLGGIESTSSSEFLLPGILIIAGAIVVGGLCIWGLTRIKK